MFVWVLDRIVISNTKINSLSFLSKKINSLDEGKAKPSDVIAQSIIILPAHALASIAQLLWPGSAGS